MRNVTVRRRRPHSEDPLLYERPDAIVFAAFQIALDRYVPAVGRAGRHLVANGAPAPTTYGCDALFRSAARIDDPVETIFRERSTPAWRVVGKLVRNHSVGRVLVVRSELSRLRPLEGRGAKPGWLRLWSLARGGVMPGAIVAALRDERDRPGGVSAARAAHAYSQRSEPAV